jgi:hypothetical protein
LEKIEVFRIWKSTHGFLVDLVTDRRSRFFKRALTDTYSISVIFHFVLQLTLNYVGRFLFPVYLTWTHLKLLYKNLKQISLFIRHAFGQFTLSGEKTRSKPERRRWRMNQCLSCIVSKHAKTSNKVFVRTKCPADLEILATACYMKCFPVLLADIRPFHHISQRPLNVTSSLQRSCLDLRSLCDLWQSSSRTTYLLLDIAKTFVSILYLALGFVFLLLKISLSSQCSMIHAYSLHNFVIK